MAKHVGKIVVGTIFTLGAAMTIGDLLCTEKIEKQIGNERVVLTTNNNPLLLGSKGRNFLDIFREDGSEVSYSDFNGDHLIDRIGEKDTCGKIKKYTIPGTDYTKCKYPVTKRRFEEGQRAYQLYRAHFNLRR